MFGEQVLNYLACDDFVLTVYHFLFYYIFTLCLLKFERKKTHIGILYRSILELPYYYSPGIWDTNTNIHTFVLLFWIFNETDVDIFVWSPMSKFFLFFLLSLICLKNNRNNRKESLEHYSVSKRNFSRLQSVYDKCL